MADSAVKRDKFQEKKYIYIIFLESVPHYSEPFPSSQNLFDWGNESCSITLLLCFTLSCVPSTCTEIFFKFAFILSDHLNFDPLFSLALLSIIYTV